MVEPETEEVAPDLALVAGRFGAALHEAGLPVTPERGGRFARVLALAAPVTLDELYWCARVTLLTGADQLPAFDATFGAIFGGLVDPAAWRGEANVPTATGQEPGPGDRTGPAEQRAGGSSSSPSAGSEPTGSSVDRDVLAAPARASSEERLATKDFAELTADELAELRSLMTAIAPAPPLRVVRRTRRHAAGDRIDLRATLRRSRRTAGDPVRHVRRRRRSRPRRLVFLLDISGSMEPYARAYLQLLHGASTAAHAEVFAFATRLTRMTRALKVSSPTLALHRAGHAAPDWFGGTRIAEALKAFLDRYGRRGMARGAVVVIVSDGWERGDPAELGRQMERLSRLAHRIVWVNPRRAAEGYEPRVGGMAAALPHCDAFVSGHSAAALAEVVAALGSTGK
jgi:uncharacterized protein with von Willebrand factor type A (vWA) domain